MGHNFFSFWGALPFSQIFFFRTSSLARLIKKKFILHITTKTEFLLNIVQFVICMNLIFLLEKRIIFGRNVWGFFLVFFAGVACKSSPLFMLPLELVFEELAGVGAKLSSISSMSSISGRGRGTGFSASSVWKKNYAKSYQIPDQLYCDTPN